MKFSFSYLLFEKENMTFKTSFQLVDLDQNMNLDILFFSCLFLSISFFLIDLNQ